MTRQGAILYVVLLSVAAIAVSSAVIAQHAVGRCRVSSLDRIDVQIATLRADAEYATARWLARHGPRMSTPIDTPYHGTTVVNAATVWDGIPVQVTTIAWDACSGVPCAGTTNDVVSWLPNDIHPPPTGSAPELWWLRTPDSARERFPTNVGSIDQGLPPLVLATSPFSGGKVHWRTAPWALVTSLVERHGRPEILSSLQAARLSGADVTIPDPQTPLPPPTLVGTTDRWCVWVNVHWGEVHHAWWTVYGLRAATPQVLVRYALH